MALGTNSLTTGSLTNVFSAIAQFGSASAQATSADLVSLYSGCMVRVENAAVASLSSSSSSRKRGTFNSMQVAGNIEVLFFLSKRKKNNNHSLQTLCRLLMRLSRPCTSTRTTATTPRCRLVLRHRLASRSLPCGRRFLEAAVCPSQVPTTPSPSVATPSRTQTWTACACRRSSFPALSMRRHRPPGTQFLPNVFLLIFVLFQGDSLGQHCQCGHICQQRQPARLRNDCIHTGYRQRAVDQPTHFVAVVALVWLDRKLL